MKNKLLWGFLKEVAFICVVILVSVYFFGEKLGDVLKELVWVYVGLAVIGVLLGIWIAYWLTRAMNPRPRSLDK